MSLQSLQTWLEQIALAPYADVLEQAAIDLDVLPHLTEEHLRELGLPLGHRVSFCEQPLEPS